MAAQVKTYTVIVRELVYKARTFRAVSRDDARDRAELSDWREWGDAQGWPGCAEIVDIVPGRRGED